MNQMLDFSVVLAALFAGILGSGHCFGMCGGISAGLGSVAAGGKAPGKYIAAVVFNTGRLLSYAILGAVSAWLLSRVGKSFNMPYWGLFLRLITLVMIFLLGLQFLFSLQLLGGIERAGGRIWKWLLPLVVRVSALPGNTGRVLLGLCWGFLPCGLVYSMLLTASSTSSPGSGAIVMLAFGLGTLPSMLGMSLAAPALSSLLGDPTARRMMGAALILLALLSAGLLLSHTHFF